MASLLQATVLVSSNRSTSYFLTKIRLLRTVQGTSAMIAALRLNLIFALCIHCCGNAIGQQRDPKESEGKDRLAEFLLQCAVRETQFSVIAKIVDTGEVKPTEHPEPSETIVRTTVAENGKRVRVDRATLKRDSGVWSPFFELTIPTEYCGASGVNVEGQEFLSMWSVKTDPKSPRKAFPFVNPRSPLQCSQGYFMKLSEAEMGYFMNGKVLDEGLHESGEYYVVILAPRGATRLTFCNEPSWAVKQIEYFAPDIEKFTFDMELSGPQNIQLDDVKKWPAYINTRTKWERANNEWLPSEIHMSQRQGKDWTYDVEIVILEWTFGDKVDLALLDPANFSKEELQSTPFEEWRKAIEKKSTLRSRQSNRQP